MYFNKCYTFFILFRKQTKQTKQNKPERGRFQHEYVCSINDSTEQKTHTLPKMEAYPISSKQVSN